MALPIITAITREIFAQTPTLHQEAALALGATRWEMIRMTVFPYARSGMVSATMLGLGRALGETMAVAMVLSATGVVTFNLISPTNPSTIAANIALQFGEASGLKVNVLIFSGLVLFVVTFAVNFLGPRDRRVAAGRRRPSEHPDHHPAARRDAAHDLPLTHPTLPRVRARARRRRWPQPRRCSSASLLGWGPASSWSSRSSSSSVALPLWSLVVEGSRAATDRLVTTLVWSAFGIAMLPLVTLMYEVVANGAKMLTPSSSPTRCATSSARAAASTTRSWAPCSSRSARP